MLLNEWSVLLLIVSKKGYYSKGNGSFSFRINSLFGKNIGLYIEGTHGICCIFFGLSTCRLKNGIFVSTYNNITGTVLYMYYVIAFLVWQHWTGKPRLPLVEFMEGNLWLAWATLSFPIGWFSKGTLSLAENRIQLYCNIWQFT